MLKRSKDKMYNALCLKNEQVIYQQYKIFNLFHTWSAPIQKMNFKNNDSTRFYLKFKRIKMQ